MNLSRAVSILSCWVCCGTASAQYVGTLVPELPGGGCGLSVDASGTLYVNDRGLAYNGTQVYKITPTGKYEVYASGLQSFPVGSVFDTWNRDNGPDYNLFVTGANFGSISKIAPDGTHTIFASGMPGAGGLEFDPDGNLYCSAFSANYLAKIDPDGVKTVFATAGELLSGPSGLAYDHSTGYLYNSNWYNGNITRYELNGDRSLFVTMPLYPIGPLIIVDGYIYTMAVNGNRIYRIALADGAITLLAGTGTPGDLDGPALQAQFRMPVGIAVNPSHDILYVSDTSASGNARVRTIVLSCPWDLDGEGNVGTGDLILLLGSWGDPYGTADLIELLGNWGPCA